MSKIWLVAFKNNPEKDYTIKVSDKENKKYDVFDDDKYLFSFGDRRYEHYHDKLGHFQHLNHNDDKRRNNYLARSKNINKIGINANTFARNFLW